MKGYFFIANIFVVFLFVECNAPPKMDQFTEECKTELGWAEGKPKDPTDVNNPIYKCYLACITKKLNIIIDGKVVLEKEFEEFTKYIPHKGTDELKQKITECVNEANKETDECEVASALHKCLAQQLHGPTHEN